MALSAEQAGYLLEEIIGREQHRTQMILLPYLAELATGARYRPPSTFVGPDGRVHRYVGPRDITSAYKAPQWLEQLAREMAIRWPPSLRDDQERQG